MKAGAGALAEWFTRNICSANRSDCENYR